MSSKKNEEKETKNETEQANGSKKYDAFYNLFGFRRNPGEKERRHAKDVDKAKEREKAFQGRWGNVKKNVAQIKKDMNKRKQEVRVVTDTLAQL